MKQLEILIQPTVSSYASVKYTDLTQFTLENILKRNTHPSIDLLQHPSHKLDINSSEAKEKISPLWPDYLVGQPDRPARVLLIDEDAQIRFVITQELLYDLRCDLVSQGSSVKDGRRLIAKCVFDVMLVGLNLGDGTGFELIELMKKVHPLADVVMISGMDDEQYALRAFELGATGYIVKNCWFTNFPGAVLKVVNGGAYISPKLERRLLHKFEQTKESHYREKDTFFQTQDDKLSKREKEVLKLVASGHSSLEIGKKLMISHQTVNTHIKNIYRKLKVRNRAQAVNSAMNFGLF